MKICRTINNIVIVVYIIALLLFLIAVFEIFGIQTATLSSIFLLLTGEPWIRLADYADESTLPWLIGLAPLVNIVIMRLACGLFGRLKG